MVWSCELDDLGLKFGTDKASNYHDYLNFYQRYFAPIRRDRIRLLEIGVFGGASLAVWEEYFPNGTIIGADIDPSTVRFARSRVMIEILDQSNLEHLVRLGVKHGPFDVIIEDGSHFWEHQTTSFKTLFPFVKDGGIYIVEDLQTNFGAMAAGYRGVASISCVEYLKRLVDLRVAHEQIDISAVEDAFLRTYGRAVHAITFYRHACLIEKSLPRAAEPLLAEPYVAVGEDPVPLLLLAHIGVSGDQVSRQGCIRSAIADRRIQGFSLHAPPAAAAGILYRARLADGGWTDWVRNGEFAGTRGKNADLTGFAVRLDGASRENFAVDMIGEFAGAAELVEAHQGEDCVSFTAGGALSGMQVILREKEAKKLCR